MNTTDNKILENVKIAYNSLDDKLGVDILILDISERSVLADYFIIATGNNPNHMKALADSADEMLSKNGLNVKHVEGMNSKEWILQDYGDILVHIFHEEFREFYSLERVWGDAKTIDISTL